MNLVPYVGPAVRYHRTKHGYSQEELAARSGLDRTYVSGVERGRRNPTISVLQKLASALKTDLDVMLITAKELARAKKGQR